MVQIEDIQHLLDLYVNRIHSATQAFLEIFGNKNPTKLWRQGLISRTGHLDRSNQIEYSFHGAGCTVQFENGEIVSFDFLEDDTITFDLFKFENFVLEKLEKKENITELFQKIELYNDNEFWKVRKK